MLTAFRTRTVKSLLQMLLELAPVEQAGERVVRRLVGDFAPECAHLGDVAEHQHSTENIALRAANRGCRKLDRVLVAMSAGEHDIGTGSDDLASRKCARRRVMHRLACRVMYDGENLESRRSRASSVVQPVRRSATGLRNSTRPVPSVLMTPSPMDCSVASARSFSRCRAASVPRTRRSTVTTMVAPSPTIRSERTSSKPRACAWALRACSTARSASRFCSV